MYVSVWLTFTGHLLHCRKSLLIKFTYTYYIMTTTSTCIENILVEQPTNLKCNKNFPVTFSRSKYRDIMRVKRDKCAKEKMLSWSRMILIKCLKAQFRWSYMTCFCLLISRCKKLFNSPFALIIFGVDYVSLSGGARQKKSNTPILLLRSKPFIPIFSSR